MTPEQCREARRLLTWSIDEMAAGSHVPAEIIALFEAGDLVGMMDLQVRMRNALEAAGIAFPFLIEDGQFVPLGVTLSRHGPQDLN